jgi:DNA gyrase subunit A
LALDAGRIAPIDIADEMQQSFIDYAMSVIASRALPDVRDGLKPVHRRILYAMEEAGNTADRPFRKSAKTVGEVIGNYHPHSDVAVYDALVRLAQDFAMRYPLVEGHGNFGCFTGDTRIRLADGTTAPLTQLAARGPHARFHVFAVDGHGRIVVAEARHARVTRTRAELVRVVLDDGSEIRCTPDHRFMLRDGSYREACRLSERDSLMPGYFDEAPLRKGGARYRRIMQPDGSWTFVHHLAEALEAGQGAARPAPDLCAGRPKGLDPREDRSGCAARPTPAGRHGARAARAETGLAPGLRNHRVVRVERLGEREDVYDVTVDGYHNFLLAAGVFVHNSVDGDPAAAMRYTEARLSRLAAEMMRDLDKDTVDFVPNYDEKSEEPVVLPSRFPNLLANGATGIAVGMATNIPPHNLRELIDGAIAVIDNPEVTSRDLMRHVRGPDFPTGGLIMGSEGIRAAYETGRGTLTLRARAHIEEVRGDRYRIVVTEIPYQVVKAKLIERIAELVRDKRLEGITDLRDETDRTGLRIVIDLARTANANVVLNRLYKETQMQQNFGVIMLALVDGQPRVLSLKQMLHHYVAHQREVVTRRSRFELDKAEKRAHILEGLRIALDHIDEVIALIRASHTTEEARDGLMARFGLDQVQADAILDMRLQRLTGLEREKIDAEYDELLKTIEYLRAVLASPAMLDGIVKKELRDVRDRYGDDRRTEITREAGEFSVEDLIAEEDVVVTLTHRGYCKRLPVDTYRSQGRGGRGVTGMTTREEDFVEQLFVAGTHDDLLFFTNRGRAYALKVHEIPEAGRTARGTAAVNLIQLDGGEQITAVVPMPRRRAEDRHLVMVTRAGVIKRCELAEFDNVRRGGIIAMSLDEGDELIDARLASLQDHILLITRKGRALRFPGEEVRPMGRAAHGVRGIRLAEGDAVVAAAVAEPDADVLIVSERGIGKRTRVTDFTVHHRGSGGVRAMSLSERTGELAGAQVVRPEHEVMLISADGVVMRQPVEGISRQGRDAAGVQLMRLEPGDRVAAVAPVVHRQGDAG